MDPPTGTVTFLFTDIVDSTEQWETDRKWMRAALECHNDALRRAIAARKGTVFKETGDGFCAVFPNVTEALHAAIEAHRRLQTATWPGDQRLQVRMAIHAGVADFHDGDYFGPTVNRAARLLSVARANQVVVSDVVRKGVVHSGEGATVTLLGSFRLKGLSAPLRAYVLKHPDLLESDGQDSAHRPRRKPKHNIAPDERVFIGRQPEVANLRHRFLVDKQRLVTITAIGGMGKTRLAREFAKSVASEFPDGAWFVECESLSTRDDIASMILSTLTIETEGAGPEESLLRRLVKKQMLLVLDCFEGVTEHAGLVEDILRKCNGVSVLVTSRTVLGLPREHEFPLRPMSEYGGVGVDDAIALFAEGASHVADGFELTRRNRRLVSQIVERLEGVPLCIVLASSRLRYISLEELQTALETERLEVLHRRGRGDDRHARIVDVIEGSLEFLTPSERTLFSELSVFVGGFTRQAAEAVCGGKPGSEMESLRDHSLVVLAGGGEKTRYKMLDTLREFASSKLEDDDRKRLAKSHALWFADFATEMREVSEKGEWERASEMLRTELGNFRAGFNFAVANEMNEAVRTYALALCRSFFEAGFWSEFETLSKAALDAASRLRDDDLAIMALGLRGAMERRRGNETAAAKIWQERLQICHRAERHEQAADTLIDLSIWAREVGDTTLAVKYLDEAKRIAESFGSRELIATVEIANVNLLLQQGRRDEAADSANRLAATKADPAKADHWLYVFGSLGPVFLELGDPRAAVRALITATRLAVEGDRLFAAGFALMHLGYAFERMGRSDAAYVAFAAATKLHAELRSKLRAESGRQFRRIRRLDPEFDAGAEAREIRQMGWRELCARASARGVAE